MSQCSSTKKFCWRQASEAHNIRFQCVKTGKNRQRLRCGLLQDYQTNRFGPIIRQSMRPWSWVQILQRWRWVRWAWQSSGWSSAVWTDRLQWCAWWARFLHLADPGSVCRVWWAQCNGCSCAAAPKSCGTYLRPIVDWYWSCWHCSEVGGGGLTIAKLMCTGTWQCWVLRQTHLTLTHCFF